MSYPQATRIAWAVLWPFFMKSLLVGLPIMLAIYVLRHSTLIASFGQSAFESVLTTVGAVVCYVVILPGCIQDAISSEYSGFRIRVIVRGREVEGLRFFESLQVSVIVLATHAIGLYLLHLFIKPPALLAIVQLPLLGLAVYPGVAVIMMHLPFYGFRLKMIER